MNNLFVLDRTKAPEVHELETVHLDVPRSEMLPNGLELSVVNYGDVDVCQIDVYVKHGVVNEKEPALVQFASRTITMGTEDYGVDQIAEILDFYGASLTSVEGDNYMMMSLKSTNRNLPKVLPVMYDCLTKPTFPPSVLEKVREKFVADVAVAQERVAFMARRRLRELLLGANHPAAVVVNEEVAANITCEKLLDFHKRYFVPGNCIVVVSGSISDAELDLVRSTFGGWEARQHEHSQELPVHPQETMYDVVQKDGALQSAVLIAMDVVPRSHPDYIKLRTLVTALGGYSGCRLMKNIREEKGYTYGIQSYLLGKENEGRIEITTQCGTPYTKAVIEEIKHELKVLREEPIGEDELHQVRSYVMSELVKTLDNAFSRASYIGLIKIGYLYEDYFDKQFDQVKNVTSRELQLLAQKYLTEDRMRIVVAGDASKM